MSPRVGVLALQGGVAEHERMLASLIATPVRVRRPHDLLALDALVVPGGESSVLDRLLDVAGLRASLTDAIRDGLRAAHSSLDRARATALPRSLVVRPGSAFADRDALV